MYSMFKTAAVFISFFLRVGQKIETYSVNHVTTGFHASTQLFEENSFPKYLKK